MRSILRTSARLDLPLAEGRPHPRPADFDTFVVDDRSGLAIGRATMRVDVCPVTKTILGFGLSSDRRPVSRPGAAAAPGRAAKETLVPREPIAWPLPGKPRTVVGNCPQFDAPTFLDAVTKLSETGPVPEG